jgi:hypothetical protein
MGFWSLNLEVEKENQRKMSGVAERRLCEEFSPGYYALCTFAIGAGHINPNKAIDPGLIYDAKIEDYVNLLCALNYSTKEIRTIT